jgi:hypothetical protein
MAITFWSLIHKLFNQGCDLGLYRGECDIWLCHLDVANLPILNSVFPTTKSFTLTGDAQSPLRPQSDQPFPDPPQRIVEGIAYRPWRLGRVSLELSMQVVI